MLILLSLALIPGTSAAATTFYVSSSSGNDSNNGTSKTSPWAHAPGMPACTGGCASYTPQPGDKFIFMGGDVWKIAGAPWTLKGSGNSSSQIYYGVDQSWFSSSGCANWGAVDTYTTPPFEDGANVILSSNTSLGFVPGLAGQTVTIGGKSYTVDNIAFGIGAEAMTVSPAPPNATDAGMTASGLWCRPVIDFGNAMTCTNFPTTGGEACSGIDLAYVSYVTLDSFDVRNLVEPNCNVGTCYRGRMLNVSNGNNGVNPGYRFTSNFFHDWTVSPGTALNGYGSSGVGAAGDLVQGNSCSQQNNGLSFAQGGCFGATTNGKILGNWCYRVSECIGFGGPGIEAAGNVIYNGQSDTADSGDHGNAIHAMCQSYIHDNLIFDLAPNGMGMSAVLNEPSGAYNSGCPNSGTFTSYSWDNVMFKLGNQTCFTDRNSSSAVYNYVHYNETCIPPSGGAGTLSSYAVRAQNDGSSTSPKGPNSELIVNMHVISPTGTSGVAPFIADASNSGSSCCMNPPGGETVTTSVAITPAQAGADGYLATNFYSPSASGNPTVNVGTNLTTNCSGMLSGLCQALSTLNLLSPGASRPALGNWDVGAYQFAGTSASAPVPPTGLTATVN